MKKKKLRNTVFALLSISLVTTSINGIIPGIQAYAEETPVDEKLNMSYLFFGDSYSNQVATTKSSLNVVSPDYFGITSSGDLLVTGKYDKAFVEEMHKQGIMVTPFLSNHWSREVGRAGLENRKVLAEQIAEKVVELNLDGVNVDLEGLTDADRENFTEFVQLLNSKIPEKEVSVAVAANPQGWNTGWHGMYDYKALADNSDYLMIMAYDENWGGDKSPGPVASLPWVEKGVQYALSQDVPSDKIAVGIPFFGRMWKTDGPTESGENILGNAVSHKNMDSFIQDFKGKVEYDEEKGSPKVTFTVKKGDPKRIVNGITLTEGKYVIWYDNEESITEKLDLVHKYNLKGIGSWSLNQEDPNMWNYFDSVLQGSLPKASETPQEQPSTEPIEKDTPQVKTTPKQTTDPFIHLVPGLLSSPLQNIFPKMTEIKEDKNELIQSIKVDKILTPATENEVVLKKEVKKEKVSEKKEIVKDIIEHKVVSGDTLSELARDYDTTVHQIKENNHLKTDLIRVGQVLKVK